MKDGNAVFTCNIRKYKFHLYSTDIVRITEPSFLKDGGDVFLTDRSCDGFMKAWSRKSMFITVLILVLLAGSLYAYRMWQQARDTSNPTVHQDLQSVKTVAAPGDTYDVIVAGTDPEGVMAAVSAARNGLKVLLMDGRDREILGGLMTLGWLNSLDLNKAPKQALGGSLSFLNKGLFQEWYDQIEGTSFDVNTAANVFNRMVAAEKNIDVLLKVRKMEPMLKDTAVAGMRAELADGTSVEIGARAVIDATQDADIAAAAGAPFTFDREDLGEPDKRMAVTLVMKLSGVTQEVWDSFRSQATGGYDKMSVSGFTAAKEYPSSNPEKVKMRGLNIGRQNDETMLINAMHLYNVNPLDPASVKAGMETGQAEAPRIVEYLQQTFPEFRSLKLAGTAPELYVRESRHIEGEYRLSMVDLLENRDHEDAIAYGSYAVDIQSTGPGENESGAVALQPQAYGVPFRALVPLQVDGLLVVGRSASFDSLSHGSARVMPLGMATGEAAGAAAKLAIEKNVTFRELSRSKADIVELRARLTAQGMDLAMPEIKTPDYAKHPAYPGLLAAASMSLTYGGYNNKHFDLDGESNALRFAYNMAGVKRVHPESFKGGPVDAVAGLADPAKTPLSLDQAAYTIALSAGLAAKPEQALAELQAKGWVSEETLSLVKDRAKLTNGDAFMLIRDVVAAHAGVVYK